MDFIIATKYSSSIKIPILAIGCHKTTLLAYNWNPVWTGSFPKKNLVSLNSFLSIFLKFLDILEGTSKTFQSLENAIDVEKKIEPQSHDNFLLEIVTIAK